MAKLRRPPAKKNDFHRLYLKRSASENVWEKKKIKIKIHNHCDKSQIIITVTITNPKSQIPARSVVPRYAIEVYMVVASVITLKVVVVVEVNSRSS